MAVNKKVFMYVKNTKNGGVYLLDTNKIKKEPGLWETVTPEPVPEPVEVEETGSVGDEISYKELKEVLTAAGVEFKGNASKEDLLQLFEETM